jgi:hypothetical protein
VPRNPIRFSVTCGNRRYTERKGTALSPKRCDLRLIREHCGAHQQADAAIGVGTIFLSPDSPRTLATECFRRELGAYSLQHVQNPRIPLPTSACLTSNTSMKRSLLQDSGGFDENYRVREDFEFCARLISRGAQPCFVPGAVAHQIYTKSSADLIRDAAVFGTADAVFNRQFPQLATQTFLGNIALEPRWKRTLRSAAAKVPALADFLLAPFCWLGDSAPNARFVRDLGIRALQMRRGIHYYRAAQKPPTSF